MLLALILAGICMSPALGAAQLPMFRRQEEESVTISREEYDRLTQYQKLDILLQLVEAYYYEDVDQEEMMESARKIALNSLKGALARGGDWAQLKNALKDDLSKFFFSKTKRNPMILPIVMEA